MKYLLKAIILVLIITQTRATILLYNTPLDTLKEMK